MQILRLGILAIWGGGRHWPKGSSWRQMAMADVTSNTNQMLSVDFCEFVDADVGAGVTGLAAPGFLGLATCGSLYLPGLLLISVIVSQISASIAPVCSKPSMVSWASGIPRVTCISLLLASTCTICCSRKLSTSDGRLMSNRCSVDLASTYSL